jgi:hypothetical protein
LFFFFDINRYIKNKLSHLEKKKKKKKTGTETRTTEWKGKKRQEFSDYNSNLTNLVNCSKEGGHLHFAQVVVAV